MTDRMSKEDGASAQPPPAPVAVGRAFRAAALFDRSRVSVRIGLLAAAPVAGTLVLGTAVGQPVAAVTMAVGAMLVGVAWRAGDVPVVPPLGTMSAAAAALALSTFLGTLSGGLPWLHLGLLVVFCLLAGTATSLGRRGAVVGNQTVIAFVVFGRFPEPAGDGLTLAGLVLLGGVAQIGLASLVALRGAWHRQRLALADAYRSLATQARQLTSTAMASAAAFDEADRRLSAPTLLVDRAAPLLRRLLQHGRRIRLELISVRSATDGAAREQPEVGRELHAAVATALARVTGPLEQIASRIESGQAATESGQADTISTSGCRLDPRRVPDMPSAGEAVRWLDTRLRTLARTISGAAALANEIGSAAVTWDPVDRHERRRRRLAAVARDLHQCRAAATLRSPAGRHALRLAVVVAGTELLIQRVALPRAYWAVVAAATVLRPDFGATFTRGAERVFGTCAGVLVATLIAVALSPNGWGIAAVVAVLACATYAVFPASFAAGIAGLTAVVVFLLHAAAPDSVTIALDRALDTGIGGAIGLAAYAVWPTWSGVSVRRRLADVVTAQARYLGAVLEALVRGEPQRDERLTPLARAARMAWSEAQAAVTLAHDEPVRRGGIDPERAAAALAALRRIVYGVHALRVEAGTQAQGRPRPELRRLTSGLRRALATIAEDLRDGDGSGAADVAGGGGDQVAVSLREMLGELPLGSGRGPERVVAIVLDELVDAVEGLTELLDQAPTAPQPRALSRV